MRTSVILTCDPDVRLVVVGVPGFPGMAVSLTKPLKLAVRWLTSGVPMVRYREYGFGGLHEGFAERRPVRAVRGSCTA